MISPPSPFASTDRIEHAKKADTAVSAEADAVALAQALAGLRERLPVRAVDALMQEHGDVGRGLAAPDAAAGQRGGNDAGIVEDEDVAGAQQLRQIAHDAVFETRRFDHQEPRGVARDRRTKRDPLRRQVEIEFGDAHGVTLEYDVAMKPTLLSP